MPDLENSGFFRETGVGFQRPLPEIRNSPRTSEKCRRIQLVRRLQASTVSSQQCRGHKSRANIFAEFQRRQPRQSADGNVQIWGEAAFCTSALHTAQGVRVTRMAWALLRGFAIRFNSVIRGSASNALPQEADTGKSFGTNLVQRDSKTDQFRGCSKNTSSVQFLDSVWNCSAND
jgi:hypothetical protein